MNRVRTHSTEPLLFKQNPQPTVGVEIELQLVDPQSWALKSAILDILEELPDEAKPWVKPELMQSYLEINSGIGNRVADVREDLEHKIRIVDEVTRRCGARLFWAATHPFSLWMDQEISPNERYYMLVEKMQDTARRIVTFGMHVHVGVDSGDKAIMVIDRFMRYLPTLLALSVNSPFWVRRRTGLMSQRCKIMEQLPAAGLPPTLRNYSEYCWLVNHSIQSGFINSSREIWWDVRPHPRFGTVEVRICDLPPNLTDVLALAAATQCLVVALSEQIDEGVYQHDIHPIMVKQNKWKALRYGTKAELVDPVTLKPIPVRDQVFYLYEKLHDYAQRLQCTAELNHVLSMIERPTGAEKQIAIHDATDSFEEVVARMVEDNPLTGRDVAAAAKAPDDNGRQAQPSGE